LGTLQSLARLRTLSADAAFSLNADTFGCGSPVRAPLQAGLIGVNSV
jgi:hypothetical protein